MHLAKHCCSLLLSDVDGFVMHFSKQLSRTVYRHTSRDVSVVAHRIAKGIHMLHCMRSKELPENTLG